MSRRSFNMVLSRRKMRKEKGKDEREISRCAVNEHMMWPENGGGRQDKQRKHTQIHMLLMADRVGGATYSLGEGDGPRVRRPLLKNPSRNVPATPSCFIMFCAVDTMPPPALPESCMRT